MRPPCATSTPSVSAHARQGRSRGARGRGRLMRCGSLGWGCSGWAGGWALEGPAAPLTVPPIPSACTDRSCLLPGVRWLRPGPGGELGTRSQGGTTCSCHLCQETFPDPHIGPGSSSVPPQPPEPPCHSQAAPSVAALSPSAARELLGVTSHWNPPRGQPWVATEVPRRFGPEQGPKEADMARTTANSSH